MQLIKITDYGYFPTDVQVVIPYDLFWANHVFLYIPRQLINEHTRSNAK